MRQRLIHFALFACTLGLMIGCDRSTETAEVMELDPNFPEPAIETGKLEFEDEPSGQLSVIGGTTYDFGLLDQKQSGSHVFTIENTSKEELHLKYGGSTCHCTGVKFNKQLQKEKQENPVHTIKPAEKVSLEVSWETRVRDGFYRESVKFYTSDPDNPVSTFFVEGKVLPQLEMTTYTVKLLNPRADEVSTGSFEVGSRVKADLKLAMKSSSNELVSIDFKPLEADYLESVGWQAGFEGIVKVDPGLPIGPFRETIVFTTNIDLKARKEVSITTEGDIAGKVIITPNPKIAFNVVSLNKGAKKSVFVKISSDDDVALKITRVRLKIGETEVDSGLVLEVPEPKEMRKNMYRIDVFVKKGAKGGRFRAQIELETDFEGAKKIIIPVKGTVAR